jgi:hypothetical protein
MKKSAKSKRDVLLVYYTDVETTTYYADGTFTAEEKTRGRWEMKEDKIVLELTVMANGKRARDELTDPYLPLEDYNEEENKTLLDAIADYHLLRS